MPIEPVAPSNVTARSAGTADDCVRKRGTVMRSPQQQAVGCRAKAFMQDANSRRKDRGSDEAVDPVHHPAVAGNELAGILGAEATLHGGFEQIASLRDDRKRERQKCDRDEVLEMEEMRH